MNIDRTSFIGLIVCVVAYISYEQYLNQKYPNRFKRQESVQHSQSHEVSSSDLGEKVYDLTNEAAGSKQYENSKIQELESHTKKVKILSDEDLTIKTPKVVYVIDQYSGGFKSITLEEFMSDDHKAKMDLIDSSLFIKGTSLNSLPKKQAQAYEVEKLSPNSFKLIRKEGPWLVSHTITIDPQSSYGANIDFKWTNTNSTPLELQSSVFFQEKIKLYEPQNSFLPGIPTIRQTLVNEVNEKTEWFELKPYCEDQTKQQAIASGLNSSVKYLGYDSHYFLKVFLPQAKQSTFMMGKSKEANQGQCQIYIKNSIDQGFVAPNESVSFNFKAWFGPKSNDLLTAFSPALTSTIDLGFFAQISKALLAAIKYIYSLMGNWGLAIIVFTVLLKILFYPLTKNSAVSMHRMKKFQPEMNRIREKYKDDPRTQQQEIMKFMSVNKVNPMKGCLPMLPQIPVFFAFYRVLSTSIDLRHASFFGWIQDLSAADPYYITPVILGVAMILQQKLTPTTGMDKTQEKMMMMMPIVFSVMMLTLPAGMVLYMLTNTIVSISQQQWLNKKLASAAA